MAVWKIDNFKRGFAQDATFLGDEPVLRNLENYRLCYEGDKVTLKVRKGMTAFNSTALANPATQLYVFRDLSNNEHILGIVTTTGQVYGTWHKILASGAHSQLSTEVATPRRMAFSIGDRVFLGTDITGSNVGWRWCDNTSIAIPATYRVGIKKPDQPPTILAEEDAGHTPSPDTNVRMNTDTQRRLAFPFTLSYGVSISAISVSVRRYYDRQDLSGAWRLKIYTDNSNKPSATLADSLAISDWHDVAKFNTGSYGYKLFNFPELLHLAASTKFWGVLEGDDAYYAHYRYNADVYDFAGVLGAEDNPAVYKYGKIQKYDSTTSSWSTSDKEAVFKISGLDVTKAYDYVYTYLNSSYGIESRPSDAARVQPSVSEPIVLIVNYAATTDAQVDKIRFYRREVASMDTVEADITDTYHMVGEVVAWAAYYDGTNQEHLGAALQTADHYCFDDTDDQNTSLRSAALQPSVGCVWKDRIWFAETNGNILYMSKILEEDGATGYVGKAIPDYFPLDNKLEVEEASGIIALRQLTDDQLVVYFKNGAVWVIEGGNEVYNPPGDLSKRQVLTNIGLLAPGALDGMRGSHIYLAQEGVHAFTGLSTPNYLSQEIQTILDAVQTSYLDDSILTCFGDELWLLVDTDNDGYKDTIFILNVQKSVPAWRRYTYPFKFNDIVVRPTGSTFKTVLAADAVNNYVYQLEYGSTDNGQPIATEIETHNFTAADRLTIMGVELDAYYPETPAAYDVIVRNSIGDEYKYLIQPGSSEDIRGHRTGCRVTTGPNARVKVQSRSVNEDELLSLAVIFQER